MLAALRKNKYILILSLYDNDIRFTIDTGATHTTLDIRTLASIFNTSVFKTNRILRDGTTQFYDFKTADYNNVSAIDCIIKNVTVGDIFLPKFNVKVGKVKNLIGMDFLKCCELRSTPGSDLSITNFDNSLYEVSTEAFELLSLSGYDKYNAWFLRLDANQKFSLEKEFRVVHYCCTLGDFENVKEQLDYIMTLPKYQVQ